MCQFLPPHFEEHVEQERISERIGDQIIDVPVSPHLEERVGVFPQKRISERIGDQIVDVSVPQISVDEVVKSSPEEQVQQHTIEHVADMPAPPIQDIVEAVKVLTEIPSEKWIRLRAFLFLKLSKKSLKSSRSLHINTSRSNTATRSPM